MIKIITAKEAREKTKNIIAEQKRKEEEYESSINENSITEVLVKIGDRINEAASRIENNICFFEQSNTIRNLIRNKLVNHPNNFTVTEGEITYKNTDFKDKYLTISW